MSNLYTGLTARGIQGPINPVYTWIETRRTRMREAMTMSQLQAICSVLEFDRWLDDEDKAGKFVEHNAHVHLAYLENDNAWMIYNLAIFDAAGECLVFIPEAPAILTKQGNVKKYRSIPALLNEMKRILLHTASSHTRSRVTFEFYVHPDSEAY